MAQSFGLTAAPILVLLGGIVGTQLAPRNDLATLPITFQIIGLASAAIPASILMSKVGRRIGENNKLIRFAKKTGEEI